MIRNASLDDLDALRDIAEGTQMFLGDELDAFLAQMQSHFVDSSPMSLIVAESPEKKIVGSAYFGPEMMAQGVSNLLFIGVRPGARGMGYGYALLREFEKQALERSQRLAIIETASDSMFEPAWRLYRKAGYTEEARIRDYYDEGLDKLLFRKHFAEQG